MSGIYEDAVTIAEELLRLVRSIAEPTPGPEGPSRHIKMDPWKVWSTKQEIQRTCDQLLVKTMGPMEFTTLLAGGYYPPPYFGFLDLGGEQLMTAPFLRVQSRVMKVKPCIS